MAWGLFWGMFQELVQVMFWGMVWRMVWGMVGGMVQGWFWKWFRNGLGIGLENPLRINSWCLNLHRFSLESLNSQIFVLFFISFLLITIEWLK